MGLPLIFDIALGLIFIFLTLSLLASEIQELITTILQWRAEHLKKSIENLLLGSGQPDSAYQSFVDDLYRSPLIRALNQEAKGLLPNFFRGIVHNVGSVYRAIAGKPETFGGAKTGPSYIPSQTFADALIEKMKLDTVSQKISELTLKQFCREKLERIYRFLESVRNSTGNTTLLDHEFDGLRLQLLEITQDFHGNRVSLSEAMNEALSQLDTFLNNAELFLNHSLPNSEIVQSRLPFVRQMVLQRKLEPTVYDVLIMLADESTDIPVDLDELVRELREQFQILPPELRRNMLLLAEKAQLKVGNLTDGVRQLRFEVEDWFNRSMDRASGVYRRNAKGVAIALGILTAILTNADAFLMVERLSQDTAVRNVIAQSTDQLVSQPSQFAPAVGGDVGQPPTEPIPAPPVEGDFATPNAQPGGTGSSQDLQSELAAVQEAVGNVLGDIPLPLGWSGDNLERQLPEGANYWLMIPRLIFGWLVTGIAISMGANFWFDLLGKVVRVRNTGGNSKPSGTD